MQADTKIRLTPKEEAFCVYYFALKNGSEAARKAGYPSKTAGVTASIYLKKSNIQARLLQLAERSPAGLELVLASIDERKQILSKIARTPMAEEEIKPDHVIRAIQEHNKMERVGLSDNVVNNYNKIEILVVEAAAPGGTPQIEG